jgi:hypothetical protein
MGAMAIVVQSRLRAASAPWRVVFLARMLADPKVLPVANRFSPSPVNARIVVVGSSNTDMVVRVPTLPRPGETVIGGTFFTARGGKGANQAVAAARAGG